MQEKSNGTLSSELKAPGWSVVNAETCVSTGLSYDEAVKLSAELTETMSGLCIVTDQAAQRLCSERDDKELLNVPLIPVPNTFSETL